MTLPLASTMMSPQARVGDGRRLRRGRRLLRTPTPLIAQCGPRWLMPAVDPKRSSATSGPGGSYDQPMSNLATIQGIYEAFGKGDVPAILEVLDERVEWEAWENNSAVNAGVP